MTFTPKAKLQLLEVLDIFKAVGIAVLLALALQSLHNQNREIQGIQNQTSTTKNVVEDLQNHIDCIVELFRQPNRANLTINDLQDCQLSEVSSNSGASAPAPSSAQMNTSTPSAGATATPQSETTTPANTTQGLDSIPVLGRVFKSLGL